MIPNILDEFVTEADFAREFGVHPRTTRNWRARPGGLPYAKPGKTVLIPVKEGRAWVRAQIINPNPTGA